MLGALAVISFVRGVYSEYSDWRSRRDRLARQAPFQQLTLPRTEEGTAPTLIYGRCLVRAPVCSFIGTLEANDISGVTENGTTWPDGTFAFGAQMYFSIGIPFPQVLTDIGYQHSVNKIYAVYNGEAAFVPAGSPLSDLTGDGNYEGNAAVSVDGDYHIDEGGLVEFLNGKVTQELVDSGGTPTTVAGERMIAEGVDATLIPAYRGYLGAFLFNRSGSPGPSPGPSNRGWRIGKSPTMPALGFEVSSYPYAQSYFATISTRVGDEANPADVIWDLLTGTFGKLGMDPLLLDGTSFRKAGETLLSEGHGYSRAIENGVSVHDLIREILDQIDGIIYDDPSTGKLVLKLIRADYDPVTIPQISPSNGRIDSLTLRGMSGLPNKVRVTYTSRDDGYQPRSATAQNMANAVGQDGLVNELELEMPGVCTAELAESIAARELANNSRPLMTCTATVSRSFLSVFPGDVVSVSYPTFNLSNVVFRVAKVNRGAASDNYVILDLVQDPAYVYRRRVHGGGGVTPFPTPPVLDPEPE